MPKRSISSSSSSLFLFHSTSFLSLSLLCDSPSLSISTQSSILNSQILSISCKSLQFFHFPSLPFTFLSKLSPFHLQFITSHTHFLSLQPYPPLLRLKVVETEINPPFPLFSILLPFLAPICCYKLLWARNEQEKLQRFHLSPRNPQGQPLVQLCLLLLILPASTRGLQFVNDKQKSRYELLPTRNTSE